MHGNTKEKTNRYLKMHRNSTSSFVYGARANTFNRIFEWCFIVISLKDSKDSADGVK